MGGILETQGLVLIATAMVTVAIILVPGLVATAGIVALIGLGLVRLIGPCGSRFFGDRDPR
jgi:hypothetical protein